METLDLFLLFIVALVAATIGGVWAQGKIRP